MNLKEYIEEIDRQFKTGIAADIWRGLQSDYDMQTARRDSRLSAILDNIRRAAAML